MTHEPTGIGKRILDLRLAKGWRFQKEFAEAVGLHPSSLNQIERGSRHPKIETIDRMASVLGVPRDRLIDGHSAESGRLHNTSAPARRHSQQVPTNAPASDQGPRERRSATDTGTGADRATAGPVIDFSTASIQAASYEALDILADVANAILVTVARRKAALAARETRAVAGSMAGGGRHHRRSDR